MQKDIKKQEEDYLKSVLTRLKSAREVLARSLNIVGEDTLSTLKELRDTVEADFDIFIQQLQEKHETLNIKDKYKRIEEVNSLLNEPYFSRVDLRKPNEENGEIQNIYIGKFGYTEDKPIITDWRAKIASIYYRYRYPQKNVIYDTPGGQEIRDLLLKRTFEIDNGELIKYYNNDIQLDEREIISEKIEQRTGGVLEDIVETIQIGQLDIIESDPRQITIVQGCVGSGKSTVAIHKLSHIFFNYPKVIHPQRSLLVAKSQILISYLSTLFPKLGVFDITYKTLRDLIINIIFREEIKIKIDLDKDNNTKEFTLRDKNEIDKMVEEVHIEYASRINDLFNDPELEVFGGYKYSQNLTPIENIDEVIKDLSEEYSFQTEKLKEKPNSSKAWFYKDNIRLLKKLLKNLSKLKEDLKYKSLEKIVKRLNININDVMGYKDTLVYLYVYAQLIGFSKYIKFEYCTVDEAQDFSILEYMVLAKFVLRGRFALFGDLNQSIIEDGITSWDDISKVIEEAKNAQVYTLDTNYRSTKPIIDLANKIISPYTKKYLPKSIDREGSQPEIQKIDTKEELLSIFKQNITDDIKDLDKSIGVIAFSDELLADAKDIIESLEIKKDKVIELTNTSDIRYIPRGVYITHFDNCKGLEFSKVYILGLNLDKIKDFGDSKKAFVSVTRAMNELCVLGLN